MTVYHSDENVTVRVTSSTTGQGSYWGMNDMTLSVVVPHPSPPHPPSPPGVWEPPSYADRWPGAAGWSGPSGMTVCGRLGAMLGGYETLGQGDAVEKTFHNLPPHRSLRITAAFTRVDALSTGFMFVDGVEGARCLVYGHTPNALFAAPLRVVRSNRVWNQLGDAAFPTWRDPISMEIHR